ncbi:MAG: hypothetical protein LC792_24345, partial [Actinobacteria bacterium]|nr:hypothetical protein [Actinomycetota bacterium]
MSMAPVVAHADIVPAPPGHASGVAAQVGSLLDISKTDATADSGASSAQASVIRLGGQPLLGLGGTQQSEGESGGSLLDTGSSLPARVEVAPWHAAAHRTGATRHATSSAAVARAALPSVVDAGVLTSDSEASHTDDKSSGRAVSDGVNLGLFDTARIVVLHSEVASDGKGHSYLVDLNGNEIGTDDQLGNSPLCVLNAPGLFGLSCLTSSGGDGSPGAGAVTNASAEVARVTPGAEALSVVNPVAAITTAASSGTGAAPASPAAAPAAAAGETSRAGASPAQAAGVDVAGQTLGQTTGRLPRTGTNPTALLSTALAALLGGVVLRRF